MITNNTALTLALYPQAWTGHSQAGPDGRTHHDFSANLTLDQRQEIHKGGSL